MSTKENPPTTSYDASLGAYMGWEMLGGSTRVDVTCQRSALTDTERSRWTKLCTCRLTNTNGAIRHSGDERRATRISTGKATTNHGLNLSQILPRLRHDHHWDCFD